MSHYTNTAVLFTTSLLLCFHAQINTMQLASAEHPV